MATSEPKQYWSSLHMAHTCSPCLYGDSPYSVNDLFSSLIYLCFYLINLQKQSQMTNRCPIRLPPLPKKRSCIYQWRHQIAAAGCCLVSQWNMANSWQDLCGLVCDWLDFTAKRFYRRSCRHNDC